MKHLLLTLALLFGCTPLWAAPPEDATAKAKAALALAGTCADSKCPCADKCECPAGKCPACPAAKIQSATSPRDALVRVKSGNGSGSGTVVWTDGKRSLVLTAAHVLASGKPVEVRADGKWHVATVVKTDESADLAAVLVMVGLPAAKVSDANPKTGDEVTMYGVTSIWSKGTISGREVIRYTSGGEGDRYLFADDPGNQYSDGGDSGGGVFLKDELCGVHCGRSGRDRLATNTPYCAGVKSVRGFLGSMLKVDGGKTVLVMPVDTPAVAPITTAAPVAPTTSVKADTIVIKGVTYTKRSDGVYWPNSATSSPATSSCPNGRCPSAVSPAPRFAYPHK